MRFRPPCCLAVQRAQIVISRVRCTLHRTLDSGTLFKLIFVLPGRRTVLMNDNTVFATSSLRWALGEQDCTLSAEHEECNITHITCLSLVQS